MNRNSTRTSSRISATPKINPEDMAADFKKRFGSIGPKKASVAEMKEIIVEEDIKEVPKHIKETKKAATVRKAQPKPEEVKEHLVCSNTVSLDAPDCNEILSAAPVPVQVEPELTTGVASLNPPSSLGEIPNIEAGIKSRKRREFKFTIEGKQYTSEAIAYNALFK